jgi:succinate dehydrogenase / fumarate reductase flavoprotein subunit
VEIPENERDYYLERKYPSFGNLSPRDISSRAAKQVCDEGRGVGPSGLGVYLDFADAIKRLGEDAIRERYDNLFEMYERITDENPYKVPMQIFRRALLMGGRWVDYNLISTLPGLRIIGRRTSRDCANLFAASPGDGWARLHRHVLTIRWQARPERPRRAIPPHRKAERKAGRRAGWPRRRRRRQAAAHRRSPPASA